MILFHHDNRRFNQGDIITGNHYDIQEDILKEYQSDELFPDMENILYMTTRVRDSWDYDNVYQVQPQGKVVKCHTQYSVVLCQEEMLRCTKHFKNLRCSVRCRDESVHEKYIKLMHAAYLGDLNAARELDSQFGYSCDNFEEYEWVCSSAKVLYAYYDYHENIDRVVQESIMNPLFNALYYVKMTEKDYASSGIRFNWHDAMYHEILSMFSF